MDIRTPLERAATRAPKKNHFRIDERVVMRDDEPESLFTWIGFADGQLALWEDGGEALPIEGEFIAGVFERYGHPVGDVGDITARVILHNGDQLLHMLYVPEFDVVPKDYLVWLPRHDKPMVELCARLTPPLMHLAKVQAQAKLG